MLVGRAPIIFSLKFSLRRGQKNYRVSEHHGRQYNGSWFSLLACPPADRKQFFQGKPCWDDICDAIFSSIYKLYCGCTRLSKNIHMLNLEHSCAFSVQDWYNFTISFPKLRTMRFKPYCYNCLQIDNNFNGMQFEGRCLEKQRREIPDLTSVVHEVAGIIGLLAFLSILYLLRIIRQEIAHYK